MSLYRAAKLARLKSPRRAGLFSLSLLFIVTNSTFCSVFGQDEVSNTDEVVRVETDLVTVPVFVTDGRGRRVAGLKGEEFEVRDDGRRVELSFFAAGADRVALLFLLDASGSARDTLEAQREAALALFSRFGEGSRVSVMHFQEMVETSLSFTTDAAQARDAFRFASMRDRRTAIFDAALAAVRSFSAGGQSPTERRIIILISDGLDTASSARASDAIKTAREANVSFYIIHLPLFAPRDGRLAPRPTAKGFRDLAEDTGGRFFTVGDARASLTPRPRPDFQLVFEAIAEDLRGQYVLGFYAAAAAERSKSRRVEVRLNARDGRRLRVRSLRDSYQLQ